MSAAERLRARPPRRGGRRRGPGATTSASRPGRRASTGSCDVAASRRPASTRSAWRWPPARSVGYLANRLGITAWRRDHPEVADGRRRRGRSSSSASPAPAPRSSTTCSPRTRALRAPLTWEVDLPVPAADHRRPTTPTRASTRCRPPSTWPTRSSPGSPTFHPMGARLGQECVRITGGDFRSMIFPTQYRVPTLQPLAARRGRPRPGLPLAPPLPPAPAVGPPGRRSGC